MTEATTHDNGGRRLLWLSHLLPWPPKGGLMQRSYYLLREVARRHEVRVVAFRQRAHQPDEARFRDALAAISEIATVSHVCDLPEDRYAGGRIGLALRSLLPGPPYTILWGTSDAYRAAIRANVAEFKPHVVHFDTISLAPYLDTIGDIPAALNHHNIESAMLLRRAQMERNPFKRFYFWQEGKRLADYERRVARRFKKHFVCAELDAERLAKTVGDVPTAVIPNGVDLEYFHPAPAGTHQDPGSMLFVGGLSWYPNLSAIRFFLKEVWPILSAQSPEIEFRIVGRNPPRDVVAAAERDRRIKVFGFVDDIHPIFNSSMVYVCPIFDGGGTKLKILDAMAMGKAIVAHPVACEGLSVRNGLQLLEAADAGAFARQVTRVLDDASLRADLERRAREHVAQNFSFVTIGAQLSNRYTTLGQASLSPARQGSDT